MNTMSRTITGLVMILIGLSMLISRLFVDDISGRFIFFIYGFAILVIGIFVLFNNREDKIEQIKKVKLNGGKK